MRLHSVETYTACKYILEKSVGTTELHYFTKKLHHVLGTRKSFYHSKCCVVYEFSYRCEARYVGLTTQRLADRIKQHVPSSIRTNNTIIREQPTRMCKKSSSEMK